MPKPKKERADRHPLTIRLRDEDHERLLALTRLLGCSKVAAVRQALLELARKQGSE